MRIFSRLEQKKNSLTKTVPHHFCNAVVIHSERHLQIIQPEFSSQGFCLTDMARWQNIHETRFVLPHFVFHLSGLFHILLAN